jgi:hypothetical protein
MRVNRPNRSENAAVTLSSAATRRGTARRAIGRPSAEFASASVPNWHTPVPSFWDGRLECEGRVAFGWW